MTLPRSPLARTAFALALTSLVVGDRRLAAQPAQTPPASSAEAGAQFAPPTSRTAEIVVESDRQAPADYLRDVLVLLDLGEPELARPIFEELTALDLSDEQRAALVSEFGTARVHRVARSAALGEAADEFARRCVAAAGQRATDPERLARLVDQLAAGDAAERREALVDLQFAGAAGVEFALARLASADDQERRSLLRAALVRMAPLSTPALTAALDASTDEVRKHAAWALGELRAAQAAPHLAALAYLEHDTPAGRAARWAVEQIAGEPFDPRGAALVVAAALENTLEGTLPGRPNAEGFIRVWLWDDQAKRPQSAELAQRGARMARAAGLAADLWRLDPTNAARERQALALRLHAEWLLREQLGAAAQVAGPRASETSAAQLSGALRVALERELTGGAIALCAALAQRGEPGVLYSPDGEPTPLAQALTASHPAVRFAALEAVMTLGPPSPFPGSSNVGSALTHFAHSSGASVAVVAMPATRQAATVAGQLATAGVEGLATNLGQEASTLAAGRADVEFVLVDMAILRPRVREVLFRLRRQPETANLPIGLLAPDGRLAEAKRLAYEHERVAVFPRPHTTEATVAIAEALQESTPLGTPGPSRRAEQAAAAARWIRTLLAQGPSYYNLRGHSEELLAAVSRTADVETAIASLAHLGTPASQLDLVNYASQDVLPIGVRERAAEAFERSVEQHGVLLTSDAILRQYDRYNASENADQATQGVLGSVLDAIESQREPVGAP